MYKTFFLFFFIWKFIFKFKNWNLFKIWKIKFKIYRNFKWIPQIVNNYITYPAPHPKPPTTSINPSAFYCCYYYYYNNCYYHTLIRHPAALPPGQPVGWGSQVGELPLPLQKKKKNYKKNIKEKEVSKETLVTNNNKSVKKREERSIMRKKKNKYRRKQKLQINQAKNVSKFLKTY